MAGKIPIASKLDRMQTLATQQDELHARIKVLSEEYDALEAEVIREMSDPKLNLERAAGKLCSVTIQRREVPKMKNYDAFITAVRRKGAFHMLERRISVTAWREYSEQNKGRVFPGTESFTKVSLLRSKLG